VVYSFDAGVRVRVGKLFAEVHIVFGLVAFVLSSFFYNTYIVAVSRDRLRWTRSLACMGQKHSGGARIGTGRAVVVVGGDVGAGRRHVGDGDGQINADDESETPETCGE